MLSGEIFFVSIISTTLNEQQVLKVDRYKDHRVVIDPSSG